MDLLVDGNAILNVVTNVVVYTLRNDSNFDLSYIMTGDKMILKDSSKRYFRNFILKYLTSVITPLRHVLKNVYLTFDSTSWRKYYVNKYFERHVEIPGFTYKGHRKTDDHKRELFMFFDYFHDEILPELTVLPGIHTLKIKGTEGDDIIAVLAGLLECDKVIWTVDSDLNQLVRNDANFTVILGPKNRNNKLRRLVLPVGYDKPKGLLDFSVDNYGISQFGKYLVAEKEYEATVIEVNDFTLRKIVMGDAKSDNIPSIYVKASKSGRRMSITDRMADRIFAEVEKEYERGRWVELTDARDTNFISKVIAATAEVVGAKESEMAEMTDNFELNCRLIRLSPHMIPPEMVGMIEYKYSQLDFTKKFDYQLYLDYAYVNEP